MPAAWVTPWAMIVPRFMTPAETLAPATTMPVALPAVLVASSMPPAPFTMLPVTVLELTNIPDAVPVACVVVLVVIVPVLLTLPVNVLEAK